jgi:hypothetical protein
VGSVGGRAPLHALLARARLSASSRGGELGWLYGRILGPAEEAAARLEVECQLVDCGAAPEELRVEAERLAAEASMDPYAAYDHAKSLAERILAVEASARAALAGSQALAAGSGMGAVLAGFTLITLTHTALGLLAGLVALVLGVAAALTSRYPLGGLLGALAGAALASALLTHEEGGVVVAAVGVGAAAVGALSLAWRRLPTPSRGWRASPRPPA